MLLAGGLVESTAVFPRWDRFVCLLDLDERLGLLGLLLLSIVVCGKATYTSTF